MKKHAREALKAARKVAQAMGHDVILLRDQTSESHYRFAVMCGCPCGKELGRFTLSESPKCADNAPGKARQAVRRLLAAVAA